MFPKLEYIDMEENEHRWFDLAGLQRHLKCVFIFHRLKIRDNKPEYLKDVPRVLGYIDQVLERVRIKNSRAYKRSRTLKLVFMKAMILAAGYGKDYASY